MAAKLVCPRSIHVDLHSHADGQIVGAIRPAHGLTRRAFIECSSSVPEMLQLFAFWLAALTWRRAADDNGAP